MPTDINSDRTSQTLSGLPFPLEYELHPEDFVAYWLYLARKIPTRLPLRVHERLVATLLPFPILVVLLAVGIPLLSGNSLGLSFHPHADIAFPLGIIVFILTSVLSLSRLGVLLVEPLHWLCWLSFRNLARAKARGGSIDTESRYRLEMTPEGIILTAERCTNLEGRRVVLRSRVEKISWKLIDSIGGSEQHVFLLTDNSIPVIIPRSAFVYARTLDWFLQQAQRYHEAEGVFVCDHPNAVAVELPLEPPRSAAIQTARDERRT